jgi:hypothetical protein
VGGASLFFHSKAILDHWDGAKWSSVVPPKGSHDLQGVDLVSPGHGFAVGSSFDQKVTVLRLC